MKESQDTLKNENLDHLGIVAGIIDEIGLVEEVNKIVGIRISRSHQQGANTIRHFLITHNYRV